MNELRSEPVITVSPPGGNLGILGAGTTSVNWRCSCCSPLPKWRWGVLWRRSKFRLATLKKVFGRLSSCSELKSATSPLANASAFLVSIRLQYANIAVIVPDRAGHRGVGPRAHPTTRSSFSMPCRCRFPGSRDPSRILRHSDKRVLTQSNFQVDGDTK